MKLKRSITPCLWFDGRAEEAAAFYTHIFSNSRILAVTRFSEVGQEFHQQPAGAVMTVAFELDGQEFTALNGGPQFQFTEAISFQVHCDTQEEIDYFWEKLSEGGDPQAQQCGWLKDRFGLSWQIVPTLLPELLKDHESAGYQRAIAAMFRMKKLDIEEMRQAYAGQES